MPDSSGWSISTFTSIGLRLRAFATSAWLAVIFRSDRHTLHQP
jgi:hypothetical protein